MIRTTLTAAALLLAIPAHAQSFYPTLYGQRFCQLRQLGVTREEAINAAIKENWSNSRQPIYVDMNGKRTSTDVIDAANYVARNCPELMK